MINKKGFSLVEMAMVITILAIVFAVSSSMVIFVVQDLIYSSNVLNMDMLANAALDEISYGDNLAGGLAFSQQITASAVNSVTFTDQSGRTVIITLNTGTNKITRTINAVADNNFLYYGARSGINFVVGKNGQMFTYYDSTDTTTATAANVRRVEINFIVRSGAGNFTNWQGSVERSSSVSTPKFI